MKEQADKPTVSACLIVKDEEEMLRGCLESIADFADEIIVVDTGSKDKTVAIAEEFGARIYHHKWNDDFSEARNVSISHATKDWILIIDADERLEKKDIPELEQIIEKIQVEAPNIHALIFRILSRLGDRCAYHQSERIFRAGNIQYKDIVHNQPVYSGDRIITRARIHHLGYDLPRAKLKKKLLRTERLLKKERKTQPYHPGFLFNLIRNTRGQEKWKELLKLVDEYFSLENSGMIKPTAQTDQMIMVDRVCAYRELGKFAKAEKAARELLIKYPNNLDGVYFLAVVYTRQGKWKEAIEAYERYLQLRDSLEHSVQKDSLVIDTWGCKADAYNNLGASYLEIGEYTEALIAFRIAYHLNGFEKFRENMLSALGACVREGLATGELKLEKSRLNVAIG